MFNLFNQNNQISVDTTPLSCISFLSHGKLHSIMYSGRNRDGDHFFSFYNACTTTCRTWFFDNDSLTLTMIADNSLLDDSKHTSLLVHNLSLTITFGTRLQITFINSSLSVTSPARDHLFDFQFFLGYFGNLFQSQLHGYSDIGSFAYTRSGTTTASTKSAKTSKSS